MDLDGYQQTVVDHQAGVSLVVAVPGSGKTTALVQRVLRLLADGIDPTAILVLTFSRSAATTFSAKLRVAAGRAGAAAQVATFHRFALQLLATAGARSPVGALLSDSQRLSAIYTDVGPRELCPEALGLDAEFGGLATDAAAAAIDRARLARSDAAALPADLGQLADAFDGYKRWRGQTDLTDLLVSAVEVLDDPPAAIRWPAALLVDEAQDTNWGSQCLHRPRCEGDGAHRRGRFRLDDDQPPPWRAGQRCAGPQDWKQFHRVQGYLHLRALRAALEATVASHSYAAKKDVAA